jgi:hypothetical protein
MLTLPLPNRSTVSIHPAGAPGTVTAWTLDMGILPLPPSFKPRTLRTCPRELLLPDRPDPLSADIVCFFASQYRQNKSPPMPVEHGSVMLRAAATCHQYTMKALQ